MIERLTELTRFRWVAALVSLAAFTLAHLSGWGVAHLIIAGFGGIVLNHVLPSAEGSHVQYDCSSSD